MNDSLFGAFRSETQRCWINANDEEGRKAGRQEDRKARR